MNTYKCSECGMVNWVTAISCSRCGTSNANQTLFSAQTTQPAPQNTTSSPPVKINAPDFSNPPSPNFYGQNVGNAQTNFPNAFHNNPIYQPQVPPDLETEFEKAEKQIRNSWIAGIVMSVLGLAGVGLLLLVGKVDLTFLFGAVFTVIIYGGLTFGVYLKSRACAVILLVIYVIDKIATMVSLGSISGIIFGIIFTIYSPKGFRELLHIRESNNNIHIWADKKATQLSVAFKK